jgi:hypothetical protein
VTRTVGMVLILVGVAACLIGAALIGVNAASGTVSPAGAVLGLGLLGLIVVAPLVGFGVITVTRGRSEQVEKDQSENMRKVLDMVKTRGRVNVSDVVIELKSDLPAVQGMIYKLVGMGVFSGYVNWDEGMLYSEDASALHNVTQCKHCGGNLTLAGKGVIKCPYCGTEYFLAQ